MKTQRLTEILTHAADTSGGTAARRLLWSLWTNRLATPAWDDEPRLNLFNAISALDPEAVAEFAGLLTLPLDDRAKLVTHILKASGEWDRVDTDAADLFGKSE